jgi:hypothetical protein
MSPQPDLEHLRPREMSQSAFNAFRQGRRKADSIYSTNRDDIYR